MAMVTPSHPGGIVNGQCLEKFGPKIGKPARGLGETRQALADFISGNSGESVELARLPFEAFGSIPES